MSWSARNVHFFVLTWVRTNVAATACIWVCVYSARLGWGAPAVGWHICCKLFCCASAFVDMCVRACVFWGGLRIGHAPSQHELCKNASRLFNKRESMYFLVVETCFRMAKDLIAPFGGQCNVRWGLYAAHHNLVAVNSRCKRTGNGCRAFSSTCGIDHMYSDYTRELDMQIGIRKVSCNCPTQFPSQGWSV